MTHAGELLSAYLDGELSPDERNDVVDHLSGCSECREELGVLDVARTAVRSMPLLEPPASLVVTPIDQARSKRRHRSRYAWAAAVAAVAVLSFGVLRGGAASSTVDFDGAVDQHIARVSVERGVASVKVVSAVNP